MSRYVKLFLELSSSKYCAKYTFFDRAYLIFYVYVIFVTSISFIILLRI